jgi:single-stranded-DNA-specific exonuclease
LQLLHGHLNIDERLQGENQFSQGLGKVFAVTGSFLQYYQTKFNLPASLHYILRLWPSANADMISYAGDRHIDSIGASYNYSMYRSTLPLNSGRALCYANLNRTLTYLRDFYPEVKIEAGLTDMRQRRMVRRDFISTASGILVSDGTHIAGYTKLHDISEVILADSPFGTFELESLHYCQALNSEVKVGIAFDKSRVEYNHSFLNRLYPELDMIKAVLKCYSQHKFWARTENINSLISKVSAGIGHNISRMEIQAILRILADLGLCRLEKSGSIMAINSMELDNISSSVYNSPYYLEGLAEKQVLSEWEMVLNKHLVW